MDCCWIWSDLPCKTAREVKHGAPVMFHVLIVLLNFSVVLLYKPTCNEDIHSGLLTLVYESPCGAGESETMPSIWTGGLVSKSEITNV